MGCAKSKPRVPQEESESPKEKQSSHSGSTRTSVRRPSASAKVETTDLGPVIDKEKDRPKVRARHNGTQLTQLKSEDAAEGRRRGDRTHGESHPRSGMVPKNLEGEQIAAGWPSWLSQVAGEAIKGWIPRHAASFEKLDKIGQGTYSNVYKARDLETGKIVALKKVRFDNLEPESVRFMAREIQVLRRLDHPNVVKLEGLVTSRMSCSLYLVFEYMEHDLAGLAACPGIMFTEAQVKCYLQQLLRGLEHCHRQGVLHRDIKGSNLLLDNGGVLKIADFGLATFFNPDQKQPLTSRVVTLWYRPPELLLGATEYGVSVDLWSTGCILAELLAGKPIMPGRTEVEQLHKIFKLCGSPSEEYWKKSKLPHATIFKPQQPYKRCLNEVFKEFPASSLALLDTLLAIEPADRGSATQALASEFFTTKPLACDPSSLPQYPPSKEFDAKIRDDEARRQRAQGSRARNSEMKRSGTRERVIRPGGAPEANAELAASLAYRRSRPGQNKSKSEKFGPLHEDKAVAYPMYHAQSRATQTFTGVQGTSPVTLGRQYGIPSAATRSGPQAPLSGSVGGGSWNKKHRDDDGRSGSRSMSRPSKSITVSDLHQGNYSHGADKWSLSSAAGSRNGPSGNHYRDRGAGRTRDGDAGHMEGAEGLSRRGDRFEAAHKNDLSKREGSYKHDQPYTVAIDGPHRRDVASVDPHSRDSMSKVPIANKQERMYHSGPLLHPGYSGASAVDFDLEEHGRRVKLLGKRATDKENGVRGEYRGKKEAETGEIVETESGFGLSSEK
ncbi:probable serine/threonine-protein kinase At1g54610 isoform X2 [Physcomitrium patens]|uniref:probable serine/threonine-protein kinase At1g54610 isoform X2 n=1 Tax=Physcomitrium patens TaxID=3218 RepID=UPI000D16D897|nr:probable serine/threonine-protein kinase At1g54610 isoform X2 [Physcomitrium patens]|eukprot:XP_024384527.1 probable serine/threonine-protein kinase At1g54610 isoform X2 [Physcomitrella patens]